MRVCIDRRVLGSEQHLVCESADRGFSWVDDVPSSCMQLSPDAKLAVSVSALVACHGSSAPTVPSGPHFEAASELLGRPPTAGDFMWQHFMPRAHFRSYVDTIVSACYSRAEPDDVSYFRDVYVPTQEFLDSLSPLSVDVVALRTALARDVSPALRSLVPSSDCRLGPTTYDRTRTVTGRAVVTAGPDIMTLPRDTRTVLTSSRGGAVAYADYSSMEPRLILGLAGRAVDGDLYTSVAAAVGMPTSTPRDAAKRAITSIVYGAGPELVARILAVDQATGREILSRVEDFFDSGTLRDGLVACHRAHGYVRSAYGKRVYPDGDRPSLLFNNFAQSTAADAALVGFMSGAAAGGEDCTIGFVLHDAAFLDVTSGSALRAFVTAAEQVGLVECRMPLQVKRVS